MTTRRGNQKLPGSRGPFLGPDGKHIEDYQDTERAARAEFEGGLLFDVGEKAIFSSRSGSVASPIDTARFIPLQILSHRWRLTKARAHLVSAATATLEAAIYSSDAVGNLTMVAGSFVRWTFDGVGTKEVSLAQEALLYPNVQYWFADWNTSAVARNWVSAYFAATPTKTYGLKAIGISGLPTRLDIASIPSNNGTSDFDRAIVAVQYLTAQAERLF